MYFDPGSTSLFIQAVFAAIAAVLGMVSRSRAWVMHLCSRIAVGFSRLWRRSDP